MGAGSISSYNYMGAGCFPESSNFPESPNFPECPNFPEPLILQNP